jgi:hypothetical protein
MEMSLGVIRKLSNLSLILHTLFVGSAAYWFYYKKIYQSTQSSKIRGNQTPTEKSLLTKLIEGNRQHQYNKKNSHPQVAIVVKDDLDVNQIFQEQELIHVIRYREDTDNIQTISKLASQLMFCTEKLDISTIVFIGHSQHNNLSEKQQDPKTETKNLLTNCCQYLDETIKNKINTKDIKTYYAVYNDASGEVIFYHNIY